jgi:hypothetical protein
MGAMTVMMGPPPSCAARDLDWSAGDWWAKARPPLWQYFSPLLKEADESIAAPKGHGPRTPAGFVPANQPLLGDRRKGP